VTDAEHGAPSGRYDDVQRVAQALTTALGISWFAAGDDGRACAVGETHAALRAVLDERGDRVRADGFEPPLESLDATDAADRRARHVHARDALGRRRIAHVWCIDGAHGRLWAVQHCCACTDPLAHERERRVEALEERLSTLEQPDAPGVDSGE